MASVGRRFSNEYATGGYAGICSGPIAGASLQEKQL